MEEKNVEVLNLVFGASDLEEIPLDLLRGLAQDEVESLKETHEMVRALDAEETWVAQGFRPEADRYLDYAIAQIREETIAASVAETGLPGRRAGALDRSLHRRPFFDRNSYLPRFRAFLIDLFSISGKSQPEEVSVSEDLVRREKPRTEAQWKALVARLVQYRLYRAWRERYERVVVWRQRLGVALAAFLIVIGAPAVISEIQTRTQKEDLQPVTWLQTIQGRLDSLSDGGGSVNVGGRALLAVAKGARATMLGESQLRLTEGSVWLDVAKSGEGFAVVTAFGRARVTGTSFGVFVRNGEMVVEVSEGSVVLERDDRSITVGAGKQAAASQEGFGDVTLRAGLFTKPAWARQNDSGHVLTSSSPPIIQGCELLNHPFGFEMRSAEEGLVLMELDRPIGGRVTFRVQYPNRLYTPGEGVNHNAYLALGASDRLADLVVCGTAMHAGANRIFLGGWNGVLDQRNVGRWPADKVFTNTVTVDFRERMVEMTVDGETIRHPLPEGLDAIRYVGYYNRNSRTAFGEIRVLSVESASAAGL